MIAAFLSGIILGIIFFGGLYLTVNALTKSRYPGLLMLASFVIRLFILLFGFYLLSDKGIYSLIAALIAVIIVRFAMTIYITKNKNREG